MGGVRGADRRGRARRDLADGELHDLAERPRRHARATPSSTCAGPDAPGVEGIPLEYCYSDGVVLDFTHKESGTRIFPDEIDEALEKIGYTLKERDIVLMHTGAGAYQDEERYRTDHCGMTAEATRHLIAQGVRMMGVDAITFDPPVWAMFEQKHFWEAHLVMMDEDYWHLENLTNLDKLPPHGFKLSVFPIKWMGTTAAPVRAVAIIDD